MSCEGLNKFTQYKLAWVKHDESSGAYAAQLIDPPAACPQGVFITHKGEIKVDSNVESAVLTYTDHPVITVRDEALVQVVNPSSHFFLYFGLTLLIAGFLYVLFRLFRSSQNTLAYSQVPANSSFRGIPGSTQNNFGGTDTGFVPRNTYDSRGFNAPRAAPAGNGTTVINNNGGGGSDLLAGVLIGSALNGGGRSERVVEKTTIIEHEKDAPAAPSSDSTFSGDKDDTFSSDDDDSYSSDSSSDDYYSSDSSSNSDDSFGSDSSDSFGGDSGGGSSFGDD